MRCARILVLVAVAQTGGCSDGPRTGTDAGVDAALAEAGAQDAGAVDAGPPSAVAVFDPAAEGPSEFWAMPFPSDLFRDDSGKIEIAPASDSSKSVAAALEKVGRLSGFCRSCAITFPIRGELDRASVPDDAGPEEQASANDPVLLLRADGAGGPIPLLVDYSAEDFAILVRPRWGIVLEPGTQYVAALTDALLAKDGTALAPSSVFAAARDGSEGGPAAGRARPLVEAALVALERAGVARESVVSIAAFTTADDRSHLLTLRDIVETAAAPTATVERVYRAADGDLDDLLGIPAEDRPGIDIPPANGAGTASIVHDAMAFVILGTFDSPRVVLGEGTDLGGLHRDASGAPSAGPGRENVPYVLIVPQGASPASLPVVLAHPGLPGSKVLGMRVGNTFARLGMAVLSIDPFQMGARAETAKDARNDFRGLEEPDGFAEHDDLSVLLRILGMDRYLSTGVLDPDLGFAAQNQWIIDAAMTIRFLRAGDISAIAAADDGLSELSFDSDQVYYLGQSNGGMVGMSFLPIARGVQAAVLGVGPPDDFATIANGPVNRAQSEYLLGKILGIAGYFDEVTRRLDMNPYVNLSRWYLEAVQPTSTLRYLFDEPLSDEAPPDVLWYYATNDEYIGTTCAEAVLRQAAVPVAGPLSLISAPPVAAPLSGNRTTPNGSVTAAGWIYEATHSVVRVKHDTTRWEWPLVPPFQKLPEPRAITNPIEALHEQVSHFFATRMRDGRAVIIDPTAR